MEIATLPCGLVVDFNRGECCKRSCPDVAKRNCNTRQPHNAIERCYNRLKAKEYLAQAELQDGNTAIETYREVCRLTHHRWIKHDSGYCECSRCHAWKREKPEEDEEDGEEQGE